MKKKIIASIFVVTLFAQSCSAMMFFPLGNTTAAKEKVARLKSSWFNMSFLPANLSHADLSNEDLDSLNLSFAWMNDSSFQRASLRYVSLNNSNISQSDFRGADLYSADFSNVNAKDIKLYQPKESGWYLVDIRFLKFLMIDAKDARVDDSNWENAKNLSAEQKFWLASRGAINVPFTKNDTLTKEEKLWLMSRGAKNIPPLTDKEKAELKQEKIAMAQKAEQEKIAMAQKAEEKRKYAENHPGLLTRFWRYAAARINSKKTDQSNTKKLPTTKRKRKKHQKAK